MGFSELEEKAASLRSEVSTLEPTRKQLIDSISSLRSTEQDARQKLDRTINEGKQALQRLEEMKANQLASNKLTEEQLKKHLQVQAALASHGISFENLDALVKVFNKFERHGMRPSTIVEFVKKINGLSEQVDAWSRQLTMVQKNLSDSKDSLDTVNNQIDKGKAELGGLRDLKPQLLAQLDHIKREHDGYLLQIDLAQTLLSILNSPSKPDQQLLSLSGTFQLIVKTRKSTTKDLLIKYEKARDLLVLLFETVGEKRLV